ncbi:MAG TPA: DNA primase [Dehalococcoidia bacterium]|nr:DNA primase [Dehalococcoidia bacterium]
MSAVDEVKQRIDIVDLVSQHVTLKRAGRNYVALCPFHTEKTPSFHLDPARQSWHCFGACSTGGDIFGFIMKKDGIEFRDALRLLAEQAGVTLETRRESQEDARRARLFEVNEAAAAYFHAMLLASDGPYTAKAEVARDYLTERGMAPASVEKFHIGYAPNSWDALVNHLDTRGITAAEAVAAGLAIEGDRGAYDRFRHRLMFPIRDERGRVAGFGGRLLPGEALGSGENQPKYVNTSQSQIFDKGAILYALDLAKDAIRTENKAVIVEGYMDVIAAHEHGYANVIASMGTALTERQVTLLKRNAPTIVLALDADNAGSEATIRSAYEIVNSSLRRKPVPNARGIVRQVESIDIDLRVLSLPEGRDPDDVVRSEPELWPVLVENAKPVLDHLFDVAAARHNLAEPRERSAMVAELAPFIALTADRVLQSHYLQRLSRMAKVDEATLRLELRQPVRARSPQNRPGESVPEDLRRQAPASRVRDSREEFCVALLFQYPELRAEASGLDPELFSHSENRALFESWVGRADDGESFERSLSPDLRPQYERILSIDLPAYDDETVVRALRTTIWGIEQHRLREAKRTRAAVLADIATAGGAQIAERARAVLEGRIPEGAELAEDEADPAAAFVEDMEAGFRLHQRELDQHRPRTAR